MPANAIISANALSSQWQCLGYFVFMWISIKLFPAVKCYAQAVLSGHINTQCQANMLYNKSSNTKKKTPLTQFHDLPSKNNCG